METPPAKKLKSLADKSKQLTSTPNKSTAPSLQASEETKKSPVKLPGLQKSSSSAAQLDGAADKTFSKPAALQKSFSSGASRGQQCRAYLNRSGPSAP